MACGSSLHYAGRTATAVASTPRGTCSRSRESSGGNSNRPSRRWEAAPWTRSPGCSRRHSEGSMTNILPRRLRRNRGSRPSWPPPMARLDKAEGAALLERFRRHLREHHQPITRQRDLVAQVVFLSEDHLSVEGIRRQLNERGERVGVATVYRTL